MSAAVHPATPATPSTVSKDHLAILRSKLSGDVLEPESDGYDEARAIWNGMIDRKPAAIALCESTADVAASVAFAREHQLPFSVRGCGHNIAGTAVRDGGLMISLARMADVTVDAGNQRVSVGPGANWGDVDRGTAPHGLVVPGGVVSTTGVGGFTLGGGFGWLTRKWGYTSDSLVSATVVTAEGRVRTVSAGTEPDLFWGIRGGGGNFGIVTEFEFDAQKLGPEVAAGLVLWSMDDADAVIKHFRELTAAAPLEVMYVLVLRVAPPAPFLPAEVHGKPVVGIAACYAGPVERGMEVLGSLRTFGTPLANTIKPKAFSEHQTFLDSGQPYGRRYYWKSVYLSEFSDGVRDALLDRATTFSSPLSSVLFVHLGGNARSMDGHSAVSNRDAEYLVNYQASWEDPQQDDKHIGWARENYQAMSPYASGQYVNFMTEDEVRDPARRAYDEATLSRLSEIKRKYDPENVFNLNKNIEPAI